MRGYIRRNAVVAAVVIGVAACGHAVAGEHGVDGEHGLLVLAVMAVVFAFGITATLHVIGIVTPRTSPLVALVIPFALVVIVGCAVLAVTSEDPDGAGVVLLASATIAASGLLGTIVGDLSTVELVVCVPFAIEGIALAQMLATDTYGVATVAGGALLAYAFVTAPRPTIALARRRQATGVVAS
ncbi:hypothetical protein HY480_01065 [Candidatus Uhrbacteria bacterium]|nr:hypothetical protein [Candidatus Uhrbacteria bacterium]